MSTYLGVSSAAMTEAGISMLSGGRVWTKSGWSCWGACFILQTRRMKANQSAPSTPALASTVRFSALCCSALAPPHAYFSASKSLRTQYCRAFISLSVTISLQAKALCVADTGTSHAADVRSPAMCLCQGGTFFKAIPGVRMQGMRWRT